MHDVVMIMMSIRTAPDNHNFREGFQKKNVPFSSLLLLRGGGEVGGDVKKLLGFFINHAFDGVLQYDSGTPKHALELKEV